MEDGTFALEGFDVFSPLLEHFLIHPLLFLAGPGVLWFSFFCLPDLGLYVPGTDDIDLILLISSTLHKVLAMSLLLYSPLTMLAGTSHNS